MPVYASFDYYDGHPSYLTPGKLYEVVKDDYTPERATGGSFHIVDDEGDDLVCLWNDCAHLFGGNWIRHDTGAQIDTPPAIGTLAELNVKPGDRVRDGKGNEANVIEVNGEPHICYPHWTTGSSRPAHAEPHPYFSVVSRAADASLNNEDMPSDRGDTPYIAAASPYYCDVPEHKDCDLRTAPARDMRLTRAPNGGWTITEYDVEFDSFAPLAAFSNAADLLDWLREEIGGAE